MIRERYIQREKEISINVVQTEVESIRQKDIEKTGFRVYENGFIGCAGAIGSYDENELENRAEAALENKIPYNPAPTAGIVKSEDYSSEIIPDNRFVDEIDELLGQIRLSQPEFYFFNKIKLIEKETNLKNDNGLDLNCRDKYLEFELVFKEKSSVNIADGWIVFNGRAYNREQIISLVNGICNAYKNRVELPREGKLPVVFESTEMLPFMKFLTDLNGNMFGSGSSIFSGRIGERIFNESFTLYQSNDPKEWITPFFDTEGTVNENYRYNLIENGVLKAPYTDKRSSLKFNLPLTGAASGDYDSSPGLGRPCLSIEASEKRAKELLNGEMGIFVIMSSGGDFTPEGNFATPVQLALLFDGERFIGRLPELNVTSNIYEMFGNDFIGVSSDKLNPLSNSRALTMRMNVSKI